MPWAGGTYYEVSGPQGAPAVVLIHGLGLTAAVTWEAIGAALMRDYRVIRYDLNGHGQSATPPGAASLTALSEQVIALMDALGVARAALVGFSLGGMINRRVAMDHPDRVRGLGILNSPHERGEELQARVEAQAQAAGEGGPFATIDAALERWFRPEFRAAQPESVARVRATVLANDPGDYAAHRWVLAHGVRELIRPVPPITCPALVMTGEEDSGSTPAMSRAISAEIEGSDCQILPGQKHLGLIEDPESFIGPLRGFLGRLPD